MKMEVRFPTYHNLKINQIFPQGWLRRQLEIQAEGLCGNLDLFWKDIKESKWIGGTSEGWERVPYWLDGFIPLAFLLRNDDMIKRAEFYINAILAGQQEDGWLCPCSGKEREHYDIWALFLVLKVLILYHDATDDDRIEEAVYKALKNLDGYIDVHTLSGWAQMRWQECLLAILWMYERREEAWMIGLAIKLKSQGFDYKNFFDNFPYQNPVKKGAWTLMGHGVNIAMALKAKALEYLLSEEEYLLKYTDYMLEQLEKYHGMVTGVFSADECLAGKSPVQGTELCTVTEMMYSLEVLIKVSGEARYGDLLEKIAFNALPAAISPDMWSHQYDQQVNQINCIETQWPVFNTNGGDSNLFGLEPHFGCCTVNFGQGWPKFALSTILQGEHEFYLVSYAPNKIISTVDGVPVSLEIIGDYPFCEQVSLLVETESDVEFSLRFRIPEYAYSTLIYCEEVFTANAGEDFVLKRKWGKKTELKIHFLVSTILESRPENLVAIKRGPLIYSLKIDEEWVQVHQEEEGKEFPHCDYEVRAKSEWRYGIADFETELCRCGVGDYPFSPDEAPLKLKVKCVPVDWEEENTCAAQMPISREAKGTPCIKTFIPYGCTNIRMTEMPYIGEVIEK